MPRRTSTSRAANEKVRVKRDVAMKAHQRLFQGLVRRGTQWAFSGLALLFGIASFGGSHTSASEQDQQGDSQYVVAHHAAGERVTSPRLLQRAPEALLHPVDHSAIEPTLGLTQDGTVFVTALAPNDRVDVLRSDNRGQSWEIVSPTFPGGQNRHLLSLDPYLFVDEDTSRVFTIDLTAACSYLSFTDDQGESWTTNPLACGRPINDHQSLFSGPPVVSPTVGYENAIYYCWNDVLTSSCSKSLDGGITFHPTGEPAFHPLQDSGDQRSARACGGLHGHGVVGADGTVYLPREYCGDAYLAISTTEGRSWDRVKVGSLAHPPGSDPSVAVDDRGNIYYLWIGPDRLPYLTVSRDGGTKWSKPLMIGMPGLKEANLPTVAVGKSGRIAIAYVGSENSLYQRCAKRARCDPPYSDVTWNGYLSISTNGLSGRPLFYSARVNDVSEPLVEGRCGQGRCGAVYDFIDVVIGPEGTPWASFVRDLGEPNPTVGVPSTASSEGLVARLIKGPSLR